MKGWFIKPFSRIVIKKGKKTKKFYTVYKVYNKDGWIDEYLYECIDKLD